MGCASQPSLRTRWSSRAQFRRCRLAGILRARGRSAWVRGAVEGLRRIGSAAGQNWRREAGVHRYTSVPALRKGALRLWQACASNGRAALPLAGRAGRDCVQCLSGAAGQLGGGESLFDTLKMLTEWGHPTRLETRIKECQLRASTEVAKTSMRNESEGVRWHAAVGSPSLGSTINRSGFFIFERFE